MQDVCFLNADSVNKGECLSLSVYHGLSHTVVERIRSHTGDHLVNLIVLLRQQLCPPVVDALFDGRWKVLYGCVIEVC